MDHKDDTIFISSSISLDIVLELDISSDPPEYGPNYREWFGEWFENQFFGVLGRIKDAKTTIGDPYVGEAYFSMGKNYKGGGYSRTHLRQYGSDRDRELYKTLETAFVKAIAELPEVKALLKPKQD